MNQVLQIPLWTYFERDPETRRWVAWVLDLDVVSVGETLEEAIEMAEDAAAMTLEHDLENDLDPSRRARQTPPDIREKFNQLMAGHKAQPLAKVKREQMEWTRVGAQIFVKLGLAERTASEGKANDDALAWPSQMCA